MNGRRIERINSLLKEVISDVIRLEVKNPHIPKLITVTHVEVSRDLRHAKVYIGVIGEQKEKAEALAALRSASGFIAIHASKQVVMRFFPELTFYLDTSEEKHQQIEAVIADLEKERSMRTYVEKESDAT